jgi:hypothetical protein
VRVASSSNRIDVVERAIDRAREAGADVTLTTGDADMVIAMQWPPFGEPQAAALAAMAAGKAVVVMETEATADWPAYDPQTWRARASGGGGAPIVVSIDPRDEEHSLMMTIRDLARDQGLRDGLGAAAQAWWRAHATPAHAAAAWQQVLTDARTLQPPARPPDWPRHLIADGTEDARAILRETGATVDFL